MITGLDRMERKLIVAALRVQLIECHALGCHRCQEIRELIQRLEEA